MEEKIDSYLEGTTLTVILGSELAKVNAPAMQQLLSSYQGQDIRKIVFDATDLVFISSAGIRCIIFAKQELSQKPEIEFVNCTKEICLLFTVLSEESDPSGRADGLQFTDDLLASPSDPSE